MLVSAVGRVEDALVRLLANHPTIQRGRGNLAPIPVDAGYPSGGPKAEHVFTLEQIDTVDQAYDTTIAETQGEMVGSKEETFTLTVRIITAPSAADGFPSARNRALELLAAIEDTLRQYHTLDGTCMFAQLAGYGRYAAANNDKSIDIVIDARVRVVAWLGDDG